MSRAAALLISGCGGCREKDGGGEKKKNHAKRLKTADGMRDTFDWSSLLHDTHNFAKEPGGTRSLAATSPAATGWEWAGGGGGDSHSR